MCFYIFAYTVYSYKTQPVLLPDDDVTKKHQQQQQQQQK